MFKPFDSVLVANRGEIAVRIIRAAHDTGLRAVAVYADGDADAPHVRLADEAYPLHGTTAVETYLDIAKIIDVSLASQAQAVHPGYGFLSENPQFAEAVDQAGLVWIGPSSDTIVTLGDKVAAREIAMRVGAPLLPGTGNAVAEVGEIERFAADHGLPIAIKAAHGGGGRGMRVVRDAALIADAFDAATRESIAAFGRDECFVERYLDKPRHVEAQVVADRYGNTVVVGLRDCSLQRRHQKLVEEAPAPFLSGEQETSIREAARAICTAAGYVSAGTVEFLVDAEGGIFFLEVNARLQVEHPVTEETTGIDLVVEQFRIAAGEPLSMAGDPTPVGHAFEFRINCEDPYNGFVPTPGRIIRWDMPTGPGIRLDSGVRKGTEVDGRFDSMLAKLIVSGPTRAAALARSRRALAEMTIMGLPTVVPFHRAITRAADFVADNGRFAVHTTWIDTDGAGLLTLRKGIAAPGAQDDEPDTVAIRIGGRVHRVRLPGLSMLDTTAAAIRAESALVSAIRDTTDRNTDEVVAPMQGTVTKLLVTEGQAVECGDLIAIVEAMKMENPVRAHIAGSVRDLQVAPGDTRSGKQMICRIESHDA